MCTLVQLAEASATQAKAARSWHFISRMGIQNIQKRSEKIKVQESSPSSHAFALGVYRCPPVTTA
jgi:hypothetical protein